MRVIYLPHSFESTAADGSRIAVLPVMLRRVDRGSRASRVLSRLTKMALRSALQLPPPAKDLPAAARLHFGLLLPGVVLTTIVAVGVAATFRAKFDFSDEAIYLYFMSRPALTGLVVIDNIAGRLGALFGNNIIVWRFVGLALLVGSAALFADGIHRLAEVCGLVSRSRYGRGVMAAFTIAGALLFYAYGSPTFSYRLASSFGILMAFGALLRAALAETRPAAHLWLILASLAAVLMLAGRASVIATYPIAALPLMWLVARRFGWAHLGRLSMLHVVYGVAWTALLVLGLAGYEATAGIIRMLAYATTTGSYRSSSIIGQHLTDLHALAASSVAIAAQAVSMSVALAAALTLVMTAMGRKPNFWRLLVRVLLHVAALLPLYVYARYAQRWPEFMATAKAECVAAHMLACQGPTPAFGGGIFLDLIGAQILCLLGLAWLDRLVYGSAGEVTAAQARPSPAEAWAVLLLFLLAVTPASSFYTNTGWFNHTILSLGPLFLASHVGLSLIRLRLAAVPAYLAAISLCLLAGLAGLLDAHNQWLFPHRVEGNVWAQTDRLDAPAALRGLYIHPHTAAIFKRVKAALDREGFDARRDVVVAAYSLPGLVVALDARALGSAWLYSGYQNIDEANCRLIARDPIDIQAIGRVFLIRNLPLAPVLADCLRARGLDLDARKVIDAFSIGPNRELTISVVPVGQGVR